MGRYYTGDIEGKFWFGVQDSDDASFFGGVGGEPTYLSYYFDGGDTEDIAKGIKTCKKELGKYEKMINEFFAENNGYSFEKLSEYLEVEEKEARALLEWHARLGLGEEIAKCVKENGECQFEAEL